MSDKKIAITRRRALTAVGTIGAGAAAAGAGTFAAFSDTETSTGELTAGTLDLSQDNSLSFTTSEIKPGDSGSDFVTLEGTGSVDGNLSISVTSVTSNESDGNSDSGNLDDQVELQLWIDEDQSSDVNGSDIGLNADGSFTSDASKGNASYATNFGSTTWDKDSTDSPGYISPFSGPVDFYVEYTFVDDTNDGTLNNNDAQGDDLKIDFEFELTQQ